MTFLIALTGWFTGAGQRHDRLVASLAGLDPPTTNERNKMSAQTVRQLKAKVKKIGVDMWHTREVHQTAMARMSENYSRILNEMWADYCDAKDELEKAKLKQGAIK